MRWSPGRSVALCLASVCFSTAYATDVALIGDAHVNSARPSTNYGTLANLYVGSGNSALLQFDLSTLPTGVTSSQVSRATLTLFVNRISTSGTVSLSPVTSAWTDPCGDSHFGHRHGDSILLYADRPLRLGPHDDRRRTQYADFYCVEEPDTDWNDRVIPNKHRHFLQHLERNSPGRKGHL